MHQSNRKPPLASQQTSGFPMMDSSPQGPQLRGGGSGRFPGRSCFGQGTGKNHALAVQGLKQITSGSHVFAKLKPSGLGQEDPDGGEHILDGPEAPSVQARKVLQSDMG